LGRSAGGHLTLLAAYLTDLPRTGCAEASVRPWLVVAFYAPTDLTQDPRDDDVRQGLRGLLGGDLSERADVYRLASPLSHVAADVPPTLLIHGTWDELVSVEHSRRLASALRNAGATVQLVEAPFAGHAFDGAPNPLTWQLAHHAIVEFLEDRALTPSG
jgi:dipeptidyl aminopeptidase/acylaminoacyl peptidase